MQQKGALVERRLRWRFADIVAQLVDVERETLAHHGLSAEQRRRLVYWVGKHVREDLQVIDLANELSMSGVTFRRRFQQTFGVTPRKWLAEERLRIIGRQLLNSTKSVQEIAAMFGYHSLSSFSRAFNAYFGCSPKQWQSAGNRIAHHGPPEMEILN